jgi:hypothetical protein
MKYWEIIKEVEADEYSIGEILAKDSLTNTNSNHPIYDENENTWKAAPRYLKKEHWEQLDLFDTFPMKGQDESF